MPSIIRYIAGMEFFVLGPQDPKSKCPFISWQTGRQKLFAMWEQSFMASHIITYTLSHPFKSHLVDFIPNDGETAP
jgi:hypothetical protein